MLFDIACIRWRSVASAAGVGALLVVLAAASASGASPTEKRSGSPVDGLLGAPVQRGTASPSPFDGRWVIAGDPWFSEIATGRGRGGPAAPGPDVVIELRVLPDGRVSGLATGITGQRGAPGSHPPHPVEITRGRLEGDTLSFEVWRFDGYHNRLHVEARTDGDRLALDFRREAPDGPVTFATHARRVEY
jgi:hypothetical protein